MLKYGLIILTLPSVVLPAQFTLLYMYGSINANRSVLLIQGFIRNEKGKRDDLQLTQLPLDFEYFVY